jgi:hypothetical protein
MDKMKIKNLKKLLGFQHFNFSLIDSEINKIENNKSENINEDFLNLLIQQQKSQQELLEELGAKFKDTGIIKELNKQIRQLENENCKNGDISHSNISAFIESEKNSLREKLNSEYGIYSFPEINFSSVLSVNFKSLKICMPLTEYDKRYIKSEEELENTTIKKQKEHDIGSNNFDFLDGGKIEFNDKNYDLLMEIIQKEFGHLGEINSIKSESSNYSNDIGRKFYLTNIKFNVIILKSHLMLNKMFKNY